MRPMIQKFEIAAFRLVKMIRNKVIIAQAALVKAAAKLIANKQ